MGEFDTLHAPELDQNALRCNSLAQMIPAIVWTATPDGKVDFANDRALDYFGTRSFDDTTWRERLHRHDYDIVMQCWQRSVSTGEPYEVSMRLRAADGEYRWFLTRGIPIRDASGTIIQWLGTTMDVDDARKRLGRHKAQTEIADLLVHARTLDEVAAPILEKYCRNLGWTYAQLWVVDRAAGVLRRKAGWCDSTLQDCDIEALAELGQVQRGVDLPGRIWESKAPISIADIRLDARSPRAETMLRAGLRSAFGFPLIVTGEVSAVLEMFSTDKYTVSQTGIDMNATIGNQIGNFIERMNVEQKLSDALHRLRRLQSLTDAALSHLSLNELLDDLLARICETVSADMCGMLLTDHDKEELYSVAFVRGGNIVRASSDIRIPFGQGIVGRAAVEHRTMTVRHALSNPTIRPETRAFGLETLAAVPLLSGRRTIGILVVASVADRCFEHDEIDFLELVAQRLANAIVNSWRYENACGANRMKDRFLSVASHELRAPITGILGWVEMLRSESDPDMRAEALDWIESCARTQAQLVKDLLDATRIREGKMEIRSENLDVRDVVQAAIHIIDSQARECGVVVEASLPDRAVSVVGDATRLQQVVWNLLGNAVKFTPAGKHVRATVDVSDRQAKITVADEGEGIQPEFLPHVFKAFEQDDNGKRAGGLGLGLHIVSSIVSMHGGTIKAMSDGVGRGATFTVSLPVAPATAA
jgi:PAS domain S-box-containing protein